MASTQPVTPIKVKPDTNTKTVSASTTKSMAFYHNLPGPRGETGTKGT